MLGTQEEKNRGGLTDDQTYKFLLHIAEKLERLDEIGELISKFKTKVNTDDSKAFTDNIYEYERDCGVHDEDVCFLPTCVSLKELQDPSGQALTTHIHVTVKNPIQSLVQYGEDMDLIEDAAHNLHGPGDATYNLHHDSDDAALNLHHDPFGDATIYFAKQMYIFCENLCTYTGPGPRV